MVLVKKRQTANILFPRSIHLFLTGGCILILLILLGLAGWLGIPPWLVRIGGVETGAVAREAASCGADDYATQGDNATTAIFAFQFSDQQGKAVRETREGVCNNLYANGEHISLWYMPQNPQSFLTDQEALWLCVFSGIWLCITVLMARFLWLLLRPLLSLPAR